MLEPSSAKYSKTSLLVRYLTQAQAASCFLVAFMIGKPPTPNSVTWSRPLGHATTLNSPANFCWSRYRTGQRPPPIIEILPLTKRFWLSLLFDGGLGETLCSQIMSRMNVIASISFGSFAFDFAQSSLSRFEPALKIQGI